MNKTLSTAGLVAAITLALGTTAPANAQFKLEFGDGDLKIDVWPACVYDKARASVAEIRESARAAGYRRVRGVTLIKRKYNNANQCGFYRGRAWRNGRQYALYFNADTASLINVRFTGKAKAPQRLNEKQARQRLRKQGFRKIRNLRFVDRAQNEFYIARARKGGNLYRVTADASTGNVVREKLLKRQRATEPEVRQALRARGYRKIRNIRFRDRRGDEFYIARAVKRGQEFRIFADAETGKPVRRVLLEKDQLNPREAGRNMIRAGFTNIRNLRKAKRNGETYYIARADRRGRTYRVFVDAEDGDIIRTRRVGNK